MNIALFPNLKKPESVEIAKKVKEFLSQKSIQCFMEPAVARELKGETLKKDLYDTIHFSITFGGDGTILRMMHRHPELQAPIFGINLGSLGFMADITINDIFPSLEDLLAGKFSVQERMVLEGSHGDKNHFFAVNDIVIHRAKNASLIDLLVNVDSIYLNTFSADGLIIATPCGSTAYSMAAGGPILTPELDAIVLTPICPHTLSNRPLVLKPEHTIEIHYLSENMPIEVTFDGITSFHMNTGENCHVRFSRNKVFKLVCLDRHDYYTTLRTKLGWSGKLRIS